MLDRQGKQNNTSKGKIIHARYIFYGFLSLLFGLTLCRHLFAGEWLYITITVVALVAVVACLLFTKRFKMILCIVLLFFSGCGLYYAGLAQFAGNDYQGQSAVVGRLCDDLYLNQNRWSVTLDNVTINGKAEKNINLYITDYSNNLSLNAGDTIAFEGEVQRARLFNLGNFQASYYRDNAPYIVYADASDVVAVQTENKLRYDEVIRQRIKQLLYSSMSSQNAGVCYAVLFGNKQEVEHQTKDLYNDVGIIHLLTVSGLHVGFLVTLLMFLLKKCNKYVRFVVILCILLLYNVLCGFTPSVLRASIMAVVMLLAKLSGKEYDSLSALSLAGFIIVLAKPLTALDSGFLMSYFCVAGIILLSKKLSTFFNKFLPRWAAEGFAVAISAQVGILPFVASFFSVFNFISVFANLIIIPIFSMLFPILFVLFVLSLIMPFMSIFFHVLDWGFVLINYIASIFSSGQMLIQLKPFPIVISIIFCLFLFLCSNFVMLPLFSKLCVASCLVLACCLSIVVHDSLGGGKNFIEYVNVGSGGICYAVNEQGESVLICQDIYKDQFDEYAYVQGIKSVDYVVSLSNDIESDLLKAYNVQSAAYPSLIATNDKSYQLQGEQKFQLGEFIFNYKYIDEKLVGICFNINNFVNYFATGNNLSYNIKDKLSEQLSTDGYTFCFVNNQSGLNISNCTVLSRYNSESKLSLYGYGNMRISFIDKKWNLRCID